MRRISTSSLVPGMVTAEDIYNYNNTLILPKGLILTDKTITKLEFYSIINVKIEDNVVETSEKYIPEELSYSDKLKASPEFKEYHKNFTQNTEKLRSAVDDLMLKNGGVDPEQIMNCTKDLIPSEGKYVNVFDMLHNMRQNDDATYAHSMNVALICNIFARWLQMKPEEVRLVTVCGMLHDIGKIKIAKNVIRKPGKLTDWEFKFIKNHPSEGYQALMPLPLDNHIKNAVLMHHERLDGSGYPLGLTGERIDPYAQIVAIADVYDAMTSARVYRGPLCPFSVVSLFENEGYQKYNARFILTFLENIVDTYVQYRVRLTDGQVGEIVYINRSKLSKPVVKIKNQYLDLSLEPHIFIESFI